MGSFRQLSTRSELCEIFLSDFLDWTEGYLLPSQNDLCTLRTLKSIMIFSQELGLLLNISEPSVSPTVAIVYNESRIHGI